MPVKFEYTEEYLRTHRLGAIIVPPDPLARKFPHPTAEETATYPASVDLRSHDAPIYDQGQLGSCVAQVGAAVIEWLENYIDSSKYFLGSRLALYKWARDADGTTGDVGTTSPTMVSVMTSKGVPHESLWPYDASQFDVEPPSSVVTDAANNKSTASATVSSGAVDNIKAALNTPLPVLFTFDVYPEYDAAGTNGGYIGIPGSGDTSRGGHANVVVGYNDALSNTDGSKGAFIVRNSWGTSWGANGYGYMPYAWATAGLMQSAYVVSAESELPAPGPAPGPTPNPQPGPADATAFAAFNEVDISDYLTKGHNGQPTPGRHTIVVFLQS